MIKQTLYTQGREDYEIETDEKFYKVITNTIMDRATLSSAQIENIRNIIDSALSVLHLDTDSKVETELQQLVKGIIAEYCLDLVSEGRIDPVERSEGQVDYIELGYAKDKLEDKPFFKRMLVEVEDLEEKTNKIDTRLENKIRESGEDSIDATLVAQLYYMLGYKLVLEERIEKLRKEEK